MDEAQDQREDEEKGPILLHNAITLTSSEMELFRILCEAAALPKIALSEGNSVEEVKQMSERKNAANVNTLTIRIAGGWVRDKLLNVPSNDIDVALDTMSGVDFAHTVRSYLLDCQSMTNDQELSITPSNQDHVTRDCKGKDKYKIGVISSNPEQSKHFETATMIIAGYPSIPRSTTGHCRKFFFHDKSGTSNAGSLPELLSAFFCTRFYEKDAGIFATMTDRYKKRRNLG